MSDSWKTEKFRKSVVDKINEELKDYKLKENNHGVWVEKDIFEKAETKRQYLGYVARVILNIRHMVCIQESWLRKQVSDSLSRPPPKLRRVLPASELGKYNLEMFKLKNKIAEEMKNKNNTT